MSDQSIEVKTYEPNTVLGVEGEDSSDLIYIKTGTVLICLTKGKEVIPLAYIGAGEILGELSFFDRFPRSANMITVEKTTIIQVPGDNIQDVMPPWLIILGRFLASQIRSVNERISAAGIKRKKAAKVPPLSIEEQIKYFDLLQEAFERN